MIYTQTYLLILFTLLCIAYIFDYRGFYKKQGYNVPKNIVLISISICLILISMFRSPTMADYEPYIEDFQYKDEAAEPLFILIRKLALFLSKKNVGIWGIYIFALVSITLKINFFKKYISYFIPAILVYISRVFVEQDMIAIRAGLSTSFALYSIYYRSQSDRCRCLVYFICAVCAHYSALLFVFVPFMNPKKSYAYQYLVGLLLSYVMIVFGVQLGSYLNVVHINVILNKLDTYTFDDTYNAFNLLQMGHVFVCVSCWYIQKKKLKDAVLIDGINGSAFLRAYTIGCIAGAIFSDIVSIAIRSSQLLFTMDVVIIPLYFRYISKNPFIQRLSVVSYSVVIFIITMMDEFFWQP